MGRRRSMSLGVGAILVALAACAPDASAPVTSGSVDAATSAPETTTARPSSDPPQWTPAPSDDVDAIVTASGGGGLITTVEVTNLVAVRPPTVGQPWLTFDLILQYCCGEPNRVVFTADDADVEIPSGADPPALRLTGPACVGAVSCAAQARTLTLSGPGPAPLAFELTPLVGAGELLEARTIRATLAPTFDFEHPGLDDAAMSIEITVDINPSAPAPSGDTTPIATPNSAVTNVGGGFQLLTFPAAAVADDAAQLAAVLAPSSRPVDVDALGIDWSTHAAIVLTIPTDACPPLLAGLAISDRRAEPVFVDAGYVGCIQPLLSHTIIASVERGMLADVDELVLPAQSPYFGTPVSAPIALTPGASHPPAAPPRPAVEFGAVLGTSALPARGEVTVSTLTNGTPVFVVHHHDGTISALDPRAPVQGFGDGPGSQFQLVTWTAATRIFLGGGAWDEYGRQLGGFRDGDLHGYATRVNGDVVEIGSPVPAPAGSPIGATSDVPAMANGALSLNDPITLDDALAQPPGTTALIDATVIVDPEGAYVCSTESRGLPIEPCPPDSPTADGVVAQPGFRTAWFGPLLATRTETGFSRIAPTGGSAGAAL